MKILIINDIHKNFIKKITQRIKFICSFVLFYMAYKHLNIGT